MTRSLDREKLLRAFDEIDRAAIEAKACVFCFGNAPRARAKLA